MKKRPILKNRVSRRSFLAGTGAVAAGITFASKGVFAAEEPKVNFYNWDTYIGETTLADFKDATGIDASMDLFADNDELFAKLKEGNPGYDVIVPTNPNAERMIAAGMLQKLDRSLIPNFSNLEPAFQDAAFDPGRQYSMPYMWGTQGLGYRVSAVNGPIDSWKVVLDSSEYSGRIAWISEVASMFGVSLMYLGYSYNATDADEIAEAEALLTAQKRHVKVIAEDNGQDLLLSGEVDIAVEWNGDILQIMDEDDDINYVVPKEGGQVWQDVMAIPNDAPHPQNAHAFINFILDDKIGADLADYIWYATPNKAAKAHLGDEYLTHPAVFPSEEAMAKLEAELYLGEERQRMIQDAWTRILAA